MSPVKIFTNQQEQRKRQRERRRRKATHTVDTNRSRNFCRKTCQNLKAAASVVWEVLQPILGHFSSDNLPNFFLRKVFSYVKADITKEDPD
mmetsp:Transcript_10854/g.25791  ORF Transcript_10854/g.25791 Transcript_10854/m.25791 type:complete len:91 (-) Transcript_10854:826-1098(-)